MFEALINLFFLILALILLVPSLVLLLQSLFSVKKNLNTNVRHEDKVHEKSLAVLVPAHNEEAVISSTLASIKTELPENARLLVVADNCTDATASLASSVGAEVIERFDDTRRGKGFALDYGVRYLQNSPTDVVIIIDADCQVTPGSIDRLLLRCIESGRPVQSQYLMHAPEDSGLKMRIAEFAWLLKNKIRPLGNSRLKWPCQLMGSGMAFPWHLIEKLDLASAHLVEDMKMGVDLSLLGYPPLFCHEAVVYSEFPTSSEAVSNQRTRWEHGHLATILECAPRLLGTGIRKCEIKLVVQALDLAVPPLAFLILVQFLLMGVTATWWLITASLQPFMFALAGTIFVFVAVLYAWHRWGRQILSFSDLISIPGYVLSKIPLYLKFWTKRQASWVRTDRD